MIERKLTTAATAQVISPNRSKIELRPSDLESLLPEVHRAQASATAGILEIL